MESKLAGLVESARGELGAMKRDGDDEKVSGGLGSQAGDGLGEHAAQRLSDRVESTVFVGVDG
jgi:hypothetical protein